jgi:ribonuclease HI
LDSIRSAKNHNHLIEEIRKRAVTLNKKNWKIEFKWEKAHVGIFGNEIADRLAKEATQNNYVTYRQKDTEKRYKEGNPERKHKKMAMSMGGNNEWGNY